MAAGENTGAKADGQLRNLRVNVKDAVAFNGDIAFADVEELAGTTAQDIDAVDYGKEREQFEQNRKYLNKVDLAAASLDEHGNPLLGTALAAVSGRRVVR